MPPQKAAIEELAEVEYRPMIKDFAASERPRERLMNQGPQALSNAELIAILCALASKAKTSSSCRSAC